MDIDHPRKRETEALIEAIWGPQIADVPPLLEDPEFRHRQNRALAVAMRAYLQQYLREAADGSTPPYA